MPARDAAQLLQRIEHARPAAPAHDVVAGDAVAGEDVAGQIDLPLGRMPGEGAHQPRQRIGDAGIARGRRAAGIAAIGQDDRGQPHQRARGLAGIALEVAQRRHRVVIEVEDARLDQPRQRRDRQAIARDRVEQRGGDGVPLRLAAGLPFEQVAPPLHPDFARQRLADEGADAGDLEAEGIERKQRRALRFGRIEAGDVAVVVLLAHQRGAMGIGLRQG